MQRCCTRLYARDPHDFYFCCIFFPVPCFPGLELVVYVCNKVNSNKGAEACITMRQQSVLLGYYRFCYRRLTFPAPFSKYFCFPGFSPPLLLPILKRSQLISVFRTHLHFAGCNSLYSGHIHPVDIVATPPSAAVKTRAGGCVVLTSKQVWC